MNFLHDAILSNNSYARKDKEFSPYSVRMRENAGQNNSEYGHFLHSGTLTLLLYLTGIDLT